MAYKVYAGRVTGTTAWTWNTKKLIYGTGDTEFLIDPKLTLESWQIGEFTFTVPKMLLDPDASNGKRENPIYDEITEIKTIIAVYQDDTLYWIGYVREVVLNFDLSKSVIVEDVLGFLKWDSVFIRPRTYYVTFKSLEDADGTSGNENLWINGNMVYMQNTRFKAYFAPPVFHVGNIDVELGTQKDFSKNGTDVSTCWDAIRKYWMDEYEGYLRVRYVENGNEITFYLDYTKDVSEKTAQCVKYGENMLDMEHDRRIPDDLVNYIVSSRQNTSTKGWWIFKTVSSTVIYGNAMDTESCKKYGVHAREITDDTATTDAALSAVCKKELAKYKQELTPTVTVKAFDLRDMGVMNTDHLGFLKKTRIVSELHGIDEWMVCTKAVLPLDKPDQKEFTFGRTPEKLTTQQNRNTNASEQASLSLKGLISYTQSKQS